MEEHKHICDNCGFTTEHVEPKWTTKLYTELKKVWCDTLTENGKYSRKSLTWLVSFGCCMGMGMVDQFTSFKINDVVFLGFLGMATGQSIVSVVEKRQKK